MNAPSPTIDPTPTPFDRARDRLADIYPPFAEKMAAYQRIAARDGRKAEEIFAEAQMIAKAFWAGLEYGREMP